MNQRGMVSINTDRINQIIEEFSGFEGKVPVALSRAINRATTAAKSEASRRVRREYTAKASTINQTIKISRASPNKLFAKIESKGSPLRLKDFRIKPATPQPRRRSAIRVEVRRGGKKSLPGGFVQRMGNASTGVFSRVGSARLPIKQLYGPAVPIMLNNEDVVKAVQERAEQQLDSRITHELNRVLGGGR